MPPVRTVNLVANSVILGLNQSHKTRLVNGHLHYIGQSHGKACQRNEYSLKSHIFLQIVGGSTFPIRLAIMKHHRIYQNRL